ncbi:MAG: Spy/CpxP family protein refolding chaperone [Chthoniobacterales bacterium]
MKPKHILPILAGVTFIGLQAVSAQDGPPPKDGKACSQECRKKCDGPRGKMGKKFCKGPKGAPNPGERMAQMLALTPEQKEKAKAIMDSKKPQIDAIRKEEREKIKAVFDEAEAELRPILTPEQIEVLDNSKKLRESSKKLREKSDKTTTEEKSE